MVSSIAPAVSAHPVQARSGYPTDRESGIPGSHDRPANNVAASNPRQAIKESAAKALNNIASSANGTPKSEMIREFLGIRRDGTPEEEPDRRKSGGLCSTMSKVARENFEMTLKANGLIDPSMSRSDMIKLALRLGPYAEDLGDSLVLPAVARMTEFCAGFYARDYGETARAQDLEPRLDLFV